MVNHPDHHSPPHGHKKTGAHARSKSGLSAEEDESIKDGLQAIYGDDRSDLHVVERDKSHLTRFLTRLVLSLALLTVLVFAGAFVYTQYFSGQGTNKPLTLEVEAPVEVKSGERVEVVVNYSNPGRIPLASLEIDVNLPPAFVLLESLPEPMDEEQLIWKVGSLGSHSDGQIVMTGVWLGSVPATTNIQALADYRPGNFNSTFSEIATASVTTLSSTLTANLTGPAAAVPGQALEYLVVIENTGTETVPASGFELELPSGFILASSTPALEPGTRPDWELGDLAPGSKTELKFTGSFTGDVKGAQTFTGTVGFDDGRKRLPQAEASAFTDVTGSDLRAVIIVNGNTDKATTEVGGTLRLSVRLDNTGTEDITGASLLLDFKPDSGIPIVWSSASLAGGKLTSAGIVFDAATVKTIKPGEKATFNLSFPVKPVLAPTEVDEWQVTAYVTVGNNKVQTPAFPISMKAKAELSASARYFSDSGAPIGNGPLPPKVGQQTTYRVFWEIDESIHALDNVTVTATLPAGVEWNDGVVTSLGNLSFDSTSRTVSWELANVAANESVTAEFSLNFTPVEADVGKFVKLLSASALNATDAETKAAVTDEFELLTTEIPTDTFAVGKGTVIE